MVYPPDFSSTCPVCKANGKLFRTIEQSVDNAQFNIHKCCSCSLCYTYPVPSSALLTKIYSGEYWLRKEEGTGRKSLAGMVQLLNNGRLAAMIRPLTQLLHPGDRILEVGCGSGQLAVYLAKQGYNIEVTDVNQELLAEITHEHGIKGFCGDLQNIDFSKDKYQAIIFNNVLEHLGAPHKNLQRASQLLDDKGFVFIEVPNIESLQFTLFGKNWFPLQLPEHLFHFSQETLHSLTKRYGLQQVWLSTFSPRVSCAGYVATLFPFLRPEKLRLSMSKPLLALYLGLQIFFLPVAYMESLLGKGSSLRTIFRKANMK